MTTEYILLQIEGDGHFVLKKDAGEYYWTFLMKANGSPYWQLVHKSISCIEKQIEKHNATYFKTWTALTREMEKIETIPKV